MYDMNESFPLGGLLEQINGGAVAAENDVVREYNAAAARLLPTLREGAVIDAEEDGRRIRLCGVELDCMRFRVAEMQVYTFALPAELGFPGVLLENLSQAILEPLNASFAASELLAGEGGRTEEGQRLYNAILRHNQFRLLHVAENLRELGYLSARPTALSTAVFDLNELCVDTVKTVYSLIRDRGIDLEYDSAGEPLFFLGDRERIGRMLLDLLANSVGHCGRGCRISLRLEKCGDGLLLTVRDDGEGMDAAGLDAAFDGFLREPDETEGPHGLGLSLAVARNVALRHGGNLLLRSAPGAGTTVSVSLPLLKDERGEFHASATPYEAGRMRPVLTAFADLLDHSYYTPDYLD